MLKPIHHRFPEVSSGKEFYINYSDTDSNEYKSGELVYTVIKFGVGVRMHYRIYTTLELCKHLCVSEEESLIWFLKFGETLPQNISQLSKEESNAQG